MGIFRFIADSILEYGASQGDPKAIDFVKRREEFRALKRQKKEQKRRKKRYFGYTNPEDEIIDWSIQIMEMNDNERP